MAEKYKIRTVRLDDDVWAKVKAMDCSLNVYLRRVLLAASPKPGEPILSKSVVKRLRAQNAPIEPSTKTPDRVVPRFMKRKFE